MGENNARGVIGHNLKYFLFCLVPIELCCMSYCKLMPIETFFLRAAVSAFRPYCPYGMIFCAGK